MKNNTIKTKGDETDMSSLNMFPRMSLEMGAVTGGPSSSKVLVKYLKTFIFLNNYSISFKTPTILYVVCTSETVFLNFKEPRNRFQGIDADSLCSMAGRYDNPIQTRLLVPIDCSKISARV